MSCEDFLKAIAIGTQLCPTAWGLHEATSGKSEMPEELANYLKDCYEKNMTPAEVIEDFV